MLRLLILRHAKAIPYAGRDDYERTLTDRGRADAGLVATQLAKHDALPELVVHSGAARTKETAAIVLRKLPPGVEVAVEPAIYDATRAGLLQIMRDLPDDSPCAMMVGHNPGLADIARGLAGRGDAKSLAKLAAKYPTAGLATLEFPGNSWAQIGLQQGALLSFVTPGDLGGEDS